MMMPFVDENAIRVTVVFFLLGCGLPFGTCLLVVTLNWM